MGLVLSASTRNIADEDGCNRKFFHNLEIRELGLPRDFHTNPEMQQNHKIDDVTGLVKADAAMTGNVFHDLIEARLLGLPEEIWEEYAIENQPEFPEACPKKSQYSMQYVRITFETYCEKYPLDDELPIWVTPEGFLSLEHKWEETEPKEGSLFPDKGFYDNVRVCKSSDDFEKCFKVPPTEPFSKGGINREIVEGGELILSDVKTTKNKLDSLSWRSDLFNKVQFPLYAEHLSKIADISYNGLVMVDGIHHTKTKRSFQRFFFEYSKDDIEKAIQYSNERIQDTLNNADSYDMSSCYAYGRQCPFYQLCFNKRYSDLPLEDRLETFLKDKSEE